MFESGVTVSNVEQYERGGEMKKSDLVELIASGENSGVEFKRDDLRPDEQPRSPSKKWYRLRLLADQMTGETHNHGMD